MAFQPIYSYSDLLKANRYNAKIEGFDFDVDTFENLIDAFTPKNNIQKILNVPYTTLDAFCKIVYGVDFNTAYERLSTISDFWMRKAMSELAQKGNAPAIQIAKEHFMNLSDKNQKDAINITIINDLGDDL